ncbi:phospholipid-transporting ATPase ID-like [Paramacrobiotus metropolitanus]|uniref:phospholipid-transporting ATPase ID-like n=1 Tax=Paramacrobiotus metropolitanus TaxID=2943436 RepID=UPI002445BDB8|nr:phospholipid-transporting ATPase ID-like [Paramacrobiotus metropolitanus]
MVLLSCRKGDATPKETERRVAINDPEKNIQYNYANNHIKTSKYNFVTFLPRNLLEQFQRLANFYFLILLVLQLIPQISSLTPFTTFVPLVIVLGLTALKDAMDDIQRHRSDNLVNGRQAFLLRNGNLIAERWDQIVVGDIIRMEDDQFVPADLLLLSSSEPNGLCYVETAELDGETNLKARQSLPETSRLKDNLEALGEFRAEILSEPPNINLNRFTGKITIKEVSYPLTNNQILLRGCILRNTAWCFGVVLFAGQDTKLMQNSGQTKFKRTHIDYQLNYIIIGIMVFLLAMCTFCAVACSIWERRTGSKFQSVQPWEAFAESETPIAVLVFFSYIILLNTVVPISLYVSVEIIRFAHSFWIDCDRQMAYKDVSAKARTTSLNEELGQINYIFSDKTGTLTQNIMTFNKCSINGRRYGDCTDDNGDPNHHCDFSSNPYADGTFRFPDDRLLILVENNDKDCDLFFSVLATCHTVMPEERDGRLTYQAQSPDEGALVDAARHFGYVFLHRTPNSIRIKRKERIVDYELLHILDFNNVRKRMSVILRLNGKIVLFCKGADSIIMDLLAATTQTTTLKSITNEHLEFFASDGLRTLCLAWKEVPASVYTEWSARYAEASVTLEKREEQMDAVAAGIERDLVLVGATAIEDKLQDGVPDAIQSLAQADIKIWVLTGDKLETAINIGYSCRLLTEALEDVFIIDADDVTGVREQLNRALKRLHEAVVQDAVVDGDFDPNVKFVSGHQVLSGETDYATVIQGPSLVYALDPELEELFVQVSCASKAVICCRVTPLQKALVVELIKKYKNAITLAIGDGANDVSMIKAAHIGVGISGQEGMQAVLASDFAIGQFRFLKRLLLVHGRWSYYRMSKFLSYFFYKNFAFTLCQMWYSFYCGFTAQTVYDPLFVTVYNLFYTSLPILALGVFDQDVNDNNSLEFPKLYSPGQRNLFFNKREFLRLHATASLPRLLCTSSRTTPVSGRMTSMGCKRSAQLCRPY